ncbi:phospholipase D-like domain-containing protein [Elusimicrobiota bacterium]
MLNKTEFVTDKDIYYKIILQEVPNTKKFLWIGTSDIKDLYVKKGRKMVPFLEILSDLISDNIAVRLIHAKEPGPAFRKDFDKYGNLITGLERILCPRVHFKSVIIDGKYAYTGSANLTGAGMGAKSTNRRNFESGIITQDRELVEKIMTQFDDIWMGKHCEDCQRKKYCTDYEDILMEE